MRHNGRSTTGLITRLFLAGCLVGVSGIVGELCGSTTAMAEEASRFAGMQKGTIGGISEGSLRIDRDEFGIVEPLEVTDQYGNPVLFKNLASGQEIYFRLDHKNRVNKVIVIIPS